MQNNAEKDGPRPRPRSFVGGNSSEFAYNGHSGGIKPTTRSLDRKEKRPMSLYESLSLDMYAVRRNSTSSARPDEDEGHRDQARPFSRLNSREKANEVNKDRENVRHSLSSDSGEVGLGQRKSSDASDSRKAARQLYAELSSPPLKTVAGDEKFNAVSRLRSLFDQGDSAPQTKNYSVPQRNKDLQHLSKSLDRRSFDGDHKAFDDAGSKTRKSEPAKFEFHHRRPKFEKVEIEKKRKLFAPPPPVKLDALLKGESPRNPEEKREWRSRRSSSKENEHTLEDGEKANEQKLPANKERKENNETVVSNDIPERKKSFEIHDILDKSTQPHHGKQHGVKKDEFTVIHERRRSLPKKRSSSFEFEALEDNIEVFGKNTIDINAMLGLEPPREDPAEEEKDEDETEFQNDNSAKEEQDTAFVSEYETFKEKDDNVDKLIKTDEGQGGKLLELDEIHTKLPVEENFHDKEDEVICHEEEEEVSFDRMVKDDEVCEERTEEEDSNIYTHELKMHDIQMEIEKSNEKYEKLDSLGFEEEELHVDGLEEEDAGAVMEILKAEESDVIKEDFKHVKEDLNEFVDSSLVNDLKESPVDVTVDSNVSSDDEANVGEEIETMEEEEKDIDRHVQHEQEQILPTSISISAHSTDEKEDKLNQKNIVSFESKERREVINEDVISAEEFKQEESEPDFSMLNGESESNKSGLEYDSFDSFALNIRDNEAKIIVEQAVTEAIQEAVEKQREDASRMSENDLLDLSTEEDNHVHADQNVMVHDDDDAGDDDLEHKLKVAKALLESEESAVMTREDDDLVVCKEDDLKDHLVVDEEDNLKDHLVVGKEDDLKDHLVVGREDDLKDHLVVGKEDDLNNHQESDIIVGGGDDLTSGEEADGVIDEEDDLIVVEGPDVIIGKEDGVVISEENDVVICEEDILDKKDHNEEDDNEYDYVSINAPDDTNEVIYVNNPFHDTVELDDDEYDSDHESALTEGSPSEYIFEENVYEDDKDSSYDEDEDAGVNEIENEPHEEKEPSESYQDVESHADNVDEAADDDDNDDDDGGDDDDDVSSEVSELPPAPVHSCLAVKSSSEKSTRKVSFQKSITDVIYTYSPEEYNRGSNATIDTVTASAEWELEKRVEEKDIFSVDLDKSFGGLGLSIIGLGVSTDSGVEKLGIFIKSLTPNGAAHKDRRIQVQDQILEVNGISLVGVTQEFAARTLKNTSGTVRFLMGRDRAKKHYQAPTSTADADLQELERKHNLEMSELISSRQRAEERAAIADHNLEEIREALLDAEDRLHVAESELEQSREEIDIMKQKQHTKQSERTDELEKLAAELSSKLDLSEESLSNLQEENEAQIEEFRLKLAEAEHNASEAKKENNHLVLMLQKNAEKLNEAEQNLLFAEKKNLDNMSQNQKFKDDNVRLETELTRIKEENNNVQKSNEAREECHEHVKLIGRLEEQVNDLKEELELKKQFSDVVVAERDSFKTLINNLERAHEKLQEAEEKMQIENAVKKMGYENKIQELEETIKELRNADATDGVPHKKLFPAIERSQLEREIEIKVQMSQPVESKPYVIPPRDYDDENPEKEAPEKEAPEEQAGEKMAFEIEAVEKEVPEEDAADEEAPMKEATLSEPEHEDEENLMADDVIVETQLIVEQCTPDFSFVEDDKSSAEAELPEKTELSALANVVNPIQKPPRRYSDINTATRTKDLPRQDKVVEEQSQEEVIVEPEKERRESILNAFEKLETEDSKGPKQIIEVKRSDTFEVIIKKDSVPEVSHKSQKSLQSEDSFFKDLPESSVDSPDASDNEIRSETQPKEDMTETSTEQVNQVNIVHEIPSTNDNSTSLVIDKPAQPETDEMGKPDSDQSKASDIETKAEGSKANPDRSSFLEALSKNPSFGSWLNGELTVIEQDRKDEQAEEIASKIADEKVRTFSSSSSSSNESEKGEHNGENDHHDDEKDHNRSIRIDESYLTASHPVIEEHDVTDSPLLRLESTDMGPLSEPVHDVRPISINFDEVMPPTTVLANEAQHDKRKLASAIPRKSPRKPSTPNVKESLDQTSEQKQLPTVQMPQNVSASRENLSTNNVINIEYGHKKDGEKDKRKSIFSFLPKFGGKKKHKRSMENLLAPEEANAHAGTPDGSPAGSDKHEPDDEEGVVPFHVKNGTNSHSPSLQNREMNVPIAFEVKINGDTDSATLVSSGDSHSAASSVVSPVSGNIAGSTENLAADQEDDHAQLSRENRRSWINRPVNEWDVRQVGLWLIRMGLEAYSQTFQERNIDGVELLNLNGSKLKELGVMHGDDRALIKRKIKEFKLNLDKDHKSKDSKKDGKSKDKTGKKIFWKGKYTVNQ